MITFLRKFIQRSFIEKLPHPFFGLKDEHTGCEFFVENGFSETHNVFVIGFPKF